MTGAIQNDSFSHLKELENKIGRKTPQSLLIWMRDAADCEGGWRSDVVDRGDSALRGGFSDKIDTLREEMRWLRSADVKILWQLLAVHESIEAMRWLMEERGALASRDSSLTGSLSSLVTVEEHGASTPPYSESSTFTLTGQETDDQRPPRTYDRDADHKSSVNMLSPNSAQARLPSPFRSNVEAGCFTHDTRASASTKRTCARLQMSQPEEFNTGPSHNTKSGIIKRALLRSSMTRREVKEDTGGFILPNNPGETQTEHQTQESFRVSQNNMVEEYKNTSSRENVQMLQGYDAHWCWMESHDDVTFV